MADAQVTDERGRCPCGRARVVVADPWGWCCGCGRKHVCTHDNFAAGPRGSTACAACGAILEEADGRELVPLLSTEELARGRERFDAAAYAERRRHGARELVPRPDERAAQVGVWLGERLREGLHPEHRQALAAALVEGPEFRAGLAVALLGGAS